MEIVIVAAFVGGIFVGTFLATLVISLCAMAQRNEAMS